MMKTASTRFSMIALGGLLAAGLASPQEAQAERKGLLDDVPAVRHRLLLVKKRFEVAPAFESTINSDFRHTLGAGLKLEYHHSDILSFGGVGFYGVSINTGLADKIISSLPEMNPDEDPTPTKDEFSSRLNEMPFHGAIYASVTPWYGKLAAFGKFFVNFDFYFQGGIALAQLKSSCASSICYDDQPEGGTDDQGNLMPPDNNPNDDLILNDGFRAGLYLGGGIHVFMNDFMALDFTVRNYLFEDNPSGLDFNADLAVTDADNRFLNHLFLGVGLSFMLPTEVKRTP